MGDKVFLAEGGVTVSRTRFVSPGGDTYAMANISSCKRRYSDEKDAIKGFLQMAAIVVSIVAGIAIGISTEFFVGIIIGIIGIAAALIFIKPKYKLYHLYVGTNSGEIDAISSRESEFIVQVERALNDAMVDRG